MSTLRSLFISPQLEKNVPLLLDNNRKEEIRAENVLTLRACVYLSVRVCALIWRGEDVTVIFSCPRMSPGTQTQVSKVGGMHLSLLNHLASLGTLRRRVRPLILTRDQGGGTSDIVISSDLVSAFGVGEPQQNTPHF